MTIYHISPILVIWQASLASFEFLFSVIWAARFIYMLEWRKEEQKERKLKP